MKTTTETKKVTKTKDALVTKTTTKEELDRLKLAKEEADKAYFSYKKKYNEEHEIKGRNIIGEIISLHKKGVSNEDIVAMGYNKNTVGHQVALYKKGKKSVKTTVRKYFTN